MNIRNRPASSDTIYVLHDNDADGMGAAFAAHMAFGPLYDVRYVEPSDRNEPPELPDADFIYILDYSWDPAKIEELAEDVRQVVVIDHHASFIRKLGEWEIANGNNRVAEILLMNLSEQEEIDYQNSNFRVVFDMERSAATLAWSFFHNCDHKEVPKAIRHIEDRDLWNWDMEGTKDLLTFLGAKYRSRESFFGVLGDIVVDLHPDVAQLRAEKKGQGGSMLRDMIADKYARDHAFHVMLRGHKIPVVNTPVFISETCERMLEHHDAPFSMCYYYDGHEEMWFYSLRSRSEFDVSEIATRFPGGGGHQQAAGFQLEENIINPL